jgi:hypothetical protein
MSEYRIATAQSPEELSNEVIELLIQGWNLQGGVSVSSFTYETGEGVDSYTEFNFTYAQALTR